MDFNRDVKEWQPSGEYEDEYADVTPLGWFNYQLGTVVYDWQIDPRLVKTLESMANTLAVESHREGFEQGDYFEGWQEGYEAGKSDAILTFLTQEAESEGGYDHE